MERDDVMSVLGRVYQNFDKKDRQALYDAIMQIRLTYDRLAVAEDQLKLRETRLW